MPTTLSFTAKELPPILKGLKEYPSLPTPSKYEKARHKMGSGIVTVYTSGKIVIQAPSKAIESALEEKIISFLGNDTNDLVFGIDETGRGERTGPLVVSGLLGHRNQLRSVRDSKKTGNIAEKYAIATSKSKMSVTVSYNAETIDELRKAGYTLNDLEAIAMEKMHELVEHFFPTSLTIADGKPLKKGMKGIVFQQKADDAEPCVSGASIIAKHTRNESGDKNERKTWKRTTRNA